MGSSAAPPPDIYEWRRLTPNDFQELCAELLRRQGFFRVEVVGGPGDEAIDIRAERLVQDELFDVDQQRVERWAIQCKHQPAKATSWTDLFKEMAGLTRGIVDHFAFFTSGRLSPPALRKVDEYNRLQEGFRINWLDGKRLWTQLVRHGLGDRVRPSGGPLASRISERLEDAWHTSSDAKEAIARAHDVLMELSQEDVSTPLVAYTTQSHYIDYRHDGVTRSRYGFALVNLSSRPLQEDDFTLQGDVGVDASDLQMEVVEGEDAGGQPLEWRLDFDTPSEKVLAVRFASEVPPLHARSYWATVSWPYAPPLAKGRYYAMSTWSLTRLLTFEITVPADVVPVGAMLGVDRNGRFSRIRDLDPGAVGSRISLTGAVENPRLGDRHIVMFGLRA